MSGVLALLGALGGMLRGLITLGNDGSGNYGYASGVYGSLSQTGFTDHGGNSRTIAIVNWTVSASGAVGFRLSGTSISNSDTTFIRIQLGTLVLARSSATYTANDGGGRTQWTWSVDTSALPTTGSQALNVD